MKKIAALLLLIWFTISCNDNNTGKKEKKPIDMTDTLQSTNGYSEVNGIKMYYEIYGQGDPLVLIHGGGSTIESTFGRIIPELSQHYKVIAMDMQNHGRSGSRDVPQTFEQDANDVITLVKNLGIGKANFFGFSNGGQTTIEIGIRYQEMINKLIIASAPYKRSGFFPGFFDMMDKGTFDSMPQPLKDDFLRVTPDSAKLLMMFNKDRDRMIAFKGWPDEELASITAPTLLINGEADIITKECAEEMHKLIKNSQLVTLPGGHGKYIGEITTIDKEYNDTLSAVPVIKEFLKKN